MTSKTLTDELRSVLLFHSLEAPEPSATVDRILADTVGSVTVLGVHGEAPAASTSAANTGPGRSRRLSVQQLSAAAVIAVLLLSVAGINSVRNRNAAKSATQASQGQAAQDQARQNQASQGEAGQDGAYQQPPGPAAGQGSGSLALPKPSDASAAQVKPPAYAGKRLDCSMIPGSKLTVGQSDDFKLSSDVEGYLFEYLCVGPDGQRSASEVQVFQRAAGAWRYVQTLPHPDAYEHLESMIAGSQVFLQFSTYRPGGVLGEIRAVVVQLSDPTRAQSYTVAAPCLLEHLEVKLTPVPDPAAPSWRLSLRNLGGVDPVTGDRSQAACALEGFPQVGVQRDGATLTSATPTMYGPAGGVTRQQTPPIIVLTRGATASAVIEQSARSAAGSCPLSDQLAVMLPTGASLGELAYLPAELSACALVVHPLVGNARGSDAKP
ncbi:MAG: hypothetical protein ABIQ09_11185 [Jatrophihabitantaceae bacterium]